MLRSLLWSLVTHELFDERKFDSTFQRIQLHISMLSIRKLLLEIRISFLNLIIEFQFQDQLQHTRVVKRKNLPRLKIREKRFVVVAQLEVWCTPRRGLKIGCAMSMVDFCDSSNMLLFKSPNSSWLPFGTRALRSELIIVDFFFFLFVSYHYSSCLPSCTCSKNQKGEKSTAQRS